MGIAVWRVTEKQKNRSIWEACQFSPRKNVCLPTQLGACSHPTGRSTGLYWFTLRGVPRGSEHQSCTNTGQSSDPSDDYMLRAALEGTHFFLGENRHAPKFDNFFGFIVTRQTAMPIQIVPRFCARGYGRFEKLLYRCQNPSR